MNQESRKNGRESDLFPVFLLSLFASLRDGIVMRILLTGASGFIGAWVTKKLSGRAGVETVLALRPTSDRWRLRMLGCDPGQANIAYADLTAAAEVRRRLANVRPEVVIHLATIYRPPGAATTAQLEQVTYRATTELFEAFVAGGGRRFITAGTCFEYGHQPPGPIPETATAQPTYDYAIA